MRFHSFDVTHNITWIKLGNDRNTTVKSDDMYDTSISSEAVTVPFFTKNITLQGHRSQLHIRDVYLGDYAKYEVHIANSAGEEVVMLVVKQIGT